MLPFVQFLLLFVRFFPFIGVYMGFEQGITAPNSPDNGE